MEATTPDPRPRAGAVVELAPGVYAPAEALRTQTARSGGPGGQNVNKVNTKVELWLAVGQLQGLSAAALARLRGLAGRRLTREDEIHLAAESQRSQEANRQEAHQRLRELLVQAMYQPKPRRKTRPTAGSRRRRIEGKKRRSELKATRGHVKRDG